MAVALQKRNAKEKKKFPHSATPPPIRFVCIVCICLLWRKVMAWRCALVAVDTQRVIITSAERQDR